MKLIGSNGGGSYEVRETEGDVDSFKFRQGDCMQRSKGPKSLVVVEKKKLT